MLHHIELLSYTYDINERHALITWNLFVAGYVPELDEDGKPKSSDGKLALSATAFFVAGGAVALRIGGRAALVNTLGLNFMTDNPELQQQLNQILEFTDTMDPVAKAGAFALAWTAVKVLCFDAGGIALALASGILFGGVFQGAIASAAAATFGSSVAFAMSKLDTPVRKKALEIVDENPSLRGIEKVVAKDGLKAILTLRLAPVLPVPLGFYNYVYGVTNVPFFDFAGGIFLGSLKPYLLDSYLGYFGKQIVDGSAGETGMQDVILLVALGVSVLIGVFASQLANETWESVLAEVEAEKKEKQGSDEEEKDTIVREVFGIKLPDFLIGFQLGLKDSDIRINRLIDEEFELKLWNYTDAKGDNPIPRDLNPAFQPTSPEVFEAYQGIDLGASTCDGLVLTPLLFAAYGKFSDPLFDEQKYYEERGELPAWPTRTKILDTATKSESIQQEADENTKRMASFTEALERESLKETLMVRLGGLRSKTEAKIKELQDSD